MSRRTGAEDERRGARHDGSRLNLRRSAAWAASLTVLLLVFLAYLRPDMALTLATQLWSCF